MNSLYIPCENCKFSQWDFRLFANIVKDGWGVVSYYSEQFDVYCSIHNKFFLETEITDTCTDGKYGENNLLEICEENRKLKDRYDKLLKKFRATRCRTDDITYEEDSPEEFDLWLKFLEERDKELFKIFTNKND